MRVLVVDDDESVRSMLQLVLGLEGFEVHVASDGLQGLERMRELDPDVIVLDIMMPGMDGKAVAQAIADDPDLDAPIVFCSALGDPEDVWAGWQLGAASYVPKPFDNDELLRELFRVTEGVRT